LNEGLGGTFLLTESRYQRANGRACGTVIPSALAVLVRRSDGTFAFAGALKKRTVKLLDHPEQHAQLAGHAVQVGSR